MNQNEFDVLWALKRKPGITQRQLADGCGISLGSVNSVLRDLKQKGLVDEASIVTDAGLAALEPYRVKNAIIMAAGLSSRFAPISYERPKGVLRVRGEVLIERQIRQLQEAGIYDITVVVGYKKEEFFYLEDAFGVKIVVNDEYAKRNNNSTIQKVRNDLDNTYICSSDDYFSENPFEQYVYDSYYAAVYQSGPTDEYCLHTKGKADQIVGVTIGGADSWIMLGHAYWSRTYSQKFVSILGQIYDEPETAGKLWEDIYIDHIAVLPMYMRRYDDGVIWEFDSLDELNGFDPDFIENVDSSIMDNICATLDCARGEIKNFKPIKEGLTNLSVLFDVNGTLYVYRHPGAGTKEIINRESEAFSQGVARELGVDRTFVYEDPIEGWKISRYIEGCVPFDYHNESHVDAALDIARKLHGSGAKSPWTFDVYAKTVEILRMLGRVEFSGFEELMQQARRLNELVKSDAVPLVLCHNDFFAPNFLVHRDGVDVVDWEYSAMSDYASDLGTFICCSDYGITEAEGVVEKYFQRAPEREEMRHCLAYVALCAYCWFVWALYKDKTGDPVGESLYLWYRMAKDFGSYAENLYED